jgi:DNA mismatch endonuclease (patch repair protein)
MTDVFTPAKRSQVMGRIHGGNTGPERKVRSLLHRLGYRFAVAGPRNKLLPASPISCCPPGTPSSRTKWWAAKIAGNKTRDARVEAEVRSLGWHVVTIWACAVKNKAASTWLEDQLPALLGPTGRKKSKSMTCDKATTCPLPMVAEE